jgi:hypothetical protein
MLDPFKGVRTPELEIGAIFESDELQVALPDGADP